MMRFSLPAASTIFLLTVVVPGCASAGTTTASLVASSARWHLTNKPRLKQDDCSGLTCSILKRAGISAPSGTRELWKDAVRDGRITEKPQPGDLVFFDYTYDKNRNGKVDDPLTHVGVVSSIDDGVLIVVHRSSRGITRLHVTPSNPGVHKQGKTVLNDYLRQPGYGPKNGKRLAGQLLRGFARPPQAKKSSQKRSAAKASAGKKSVVDRRSRFD